MNATWTRFKKHRLGTCALGFVALLILIATYAPLLASSKPLLVWYEGSFYFPLLRYLFYKGFFSKPIDLFYNLLMFTLPLFVGAFFLKRGRGLVWGALAFCQITFFFVFLSGVIKDPDKKGYHALNALLSFHTKQERQQRLAPYLQKAPENIQAQLNSDQNNLETEKKQLERKILESESTYQESLKILPSLKEEISALTIETKLAEVEKRETFAEKKEQLALQSLNLQKAQQEIAEYRSYVFEKTTLDNAEKWQKQESQKMKILLKPLVRPFHWEDDAGGSQGMNHFLPWWELTRLNRKDMGAALLFGIRISLVVGAATVFLALAIGIPLGLFSGYFAGKTDLIICRLIEIWEAMPLFFMLLLIVAITQSKSIFLVVLILALFGWTHFARYVRAEVLRQRSLPYVLAKKSLGFGSYKIMVSEVLPNALFAVLTLIPFSIMAAITSEAGLSFLGLGEEGSTSLGTLMAEARSVFPAESYLLWPPAILLTTLLVAIALAGDALRDASDPKMKI